MKDLYRLQDIIADEAAKYFHGQQVDYEKIRNFVISLTSVSDWHPYFYYRCYIRYLNAQRGNSGEKNIQNQA
jgi:hypothetical protein